MNLVKHVEREMEKNVLICTKLLQNPDDAYTYVYIQPVKCEL